MLELAPLSIHVSHCLGVYVVVQFHPCFKFYFPLFQAQFYKLPDYTPQNCWIIILFWETGPKPTLPLASHLGQKIDPQKIGLKEG